VLSHREVSQIEAAMACKYRRLESGRSELSTERLSTDANRTDSNPLDIQREAGTGLSSDGVFDASDLPFGSTVIDTTLLPVPPCKSVTVSWNLSTAVLFTSGAMK
jgi:hypothetical protein